MFPNINIVFFQQHDSCANKTKYEYFKVNKILKFVMQIALKVSEMEIFPRFTSKFPGIFIVMTDGIRYSDNQKSNNMNILSF